jgi:hypothetical protein
MRMMVALIYAAGVIQIGIVLGNIPLPRKLELRANLAKLPVFLRQVFLVHWLFILIVVLLFAALCFGFAPDLAGATALGRFLSGAMGAFWLLRLFLQLFYYDRELRRQNRLLDVAYIFSVAFLASVFGIAALGVMR